jgi:two-component system, LytTR family, response regulator
MPILTVLIVDDEPLARQRLRRILSDEPDVEIAGECASGDEAVRMIGERRPDVVLLDIRMPKLDGFGVVRALPPDAAPIVVFVTAFDEHATSAFDVQALDYVMKPVEPERLRLALARARRQHETTSTVERHQRLLAILREESGPSPATADSSPRARALPTPRRILVKEKDRRFFVNTADVDWLEAYGNYVRLHVAGRVHLLRATMAQLEQSLDPDDFARIHRSSIVNLSRVKEVQPWFSSEYVVILKDGTRLKMGRAYRDQFERRGLL